MGSDEDGITLDLLKGFRFLRGREVEHALAWNRHEGRIRRDYDIHGSIRSLHFRVQDADSACRGCRPKIAAASRAEPASFNNRSAIKNARAVAVTCA
ncbi:MAG: hypothetical protein WA254_01130, partial [Candidatus Sulfotelmatobacter sp.]